MSATESISHVEVMPRESTAALTAVRKRPQPQRRHLQRPTAPPRPAHSQPPEPRHGPRTSLPFQKNHMRPKNHTYIHGVRNNPLKLRGLDITCKHTHSYSSNTNKDSPENFVSSCSVERYTHVQSAEDPPRTAPDNRGDNAQPPIWPNLHKLRIG